MSGPLIAAAPVAHPLQPRIKTFAICQPVLCFQLPLEEELEGNPNSRGLGATPGRRDRKIIIQCDRQQDTTAGAIFQMPPRTFADLRRAAASGTLATCNTLTLSLGIMTDVRSGERRKVIR